MSRSWYTHAALVTGASAGLTEPRAGRRDAYQFRGGKLADEQDAKAEHADRAEQRHGRHCPRPVPDRLLGERPGRGHASLHRLVGLEAASVEVGAHSRTHRQPDLR